MPYLPLKDARLHYEVKGKGAPLLLIAGLACHSGHWKFIKPTLAETFQVITMDNRSTGRTGDPDHHYTIETIAEDSIALLKHLKFSCVHLLGHSMGGAIAQVIAHRYPSYVEKLLISNSFVKMTPRTLLWMRHCAWLQEQHKTVEERMPVIAPWVFSNKFLSHPKALEKLIHAATTDPYPQTAKGFRQQVEAITHFDSRAWVHEIRASTFIIAGEEDFLTPMRDAEYLRDHIKDSTLIVQEGSHSPMLEIPSKYVRDVKKILL
ncbi:MAG: alpha/beta fold hydrolase [Chthoniobacterales bacterium]